MQELVSTNALHQGPMSFARPDFGKTFNFPVIGVQSLNLTTWAARTRGSDFRRWTRVWTLLAPMRMLPITDPIDPAEPEVRLSLLTPQAGFISKSLIISRRKIQKAPFFWISVSLFCYLWVEYISLKEEHLCHGNSGKGSSIGISLPFLLANIFRLTEAFFFLLLPTTQ